MNTVKIVPVLYASQVAACIDKNRFKPKREVLENMWERLDPKGYRKALNRNQKKTEKEQIQIIMEKHVAVKHAVQHSLDVVKDTSHETLQDCVETKAAIEDVPMSVEEKRLIEKTIQTNSYTQYGTREEVNVKDILEREYDIVDIIDDTKFHKKTFTSPQGHTFIVGGKIDGFTSDRETVLEIKNRVKRLFHQVYEYEEIQLQTYLQILDKKQGKLIECHKGLDGIPEIDIHDVPKDDAMWNDTILPGLEKFVHVLINVVQNEKTQDAFLNKKKT